MSDMRPIPYLVKLVRDGVTTKLTTDTITYEPIHDREEALKLLRGKLVEEAVEYLLEPSAHELADLLEVVEGLTMHDPAIPGGMDEVRDQQVAKRARRGSFFDMIGMYAQTSAGRWQ